MRTLLFGVLLGAVAGVLYAPATGNRTRALLKDKLNKYSNDTNCFIDSKGRHLHNKMQGVKHDVSCKLDGVKERVSEYRTQMEPMTESLKAKAEEVKARAEEVKGDLSIRMDDVREKLETKVLDARAQLDRKVEEVKERLDEITSSDSEISSGSGPMTEEERRRSA